jgi:hypothetical protein
MANLTGSGRGTGIFGMGVGDSVRDGDAISYDVVCGGATDDGVVDSSVSDRGVAFEDGAISGGVVRHADPSDLLTRQIK